MRARALLLLAACVAPFLAAPAAAVPWNNDCGSNRDSTSGSPVVLRNNLNCQGAMNPCSDYGTSGGWSYGPADFYTFEATRDDFITFRFNPPYGSDPYTGTFPVVEADVWGPGFSRGYLTDDTTFLAPETGTYHVELTYIARGGFSAPEAPGYHQPNCTDDTYGIGVTVTANDRPVVSAITVPDYVVYGEPVDFSIRATDVDSNGLQFGINTGTGTRWQGPASGFVSAGTWTFQDEVLTRQTNVVFSASDMRGAVGSIVRTITAREDDCGLGRDVVTEPRVLPFACHATLWAPIGDHADNFTFPVDPSRPRLYASLAPAPNFATGEYRFVLRAPDGTEAANATTRSLLAPLGIAGNWTLEVLRLAGSGSFDVAVRQVGPAAPPALSAAFSSLAVHQGDALTIDLAATDPNGLPTFTTVDWGDGTVDRFPATGLAASGTAFRATHVYHAVLAQAPLVTLRATNEEGLARETARTVAVAWHADCGLAPGQDRAGTRASATSPPPGTCVGEVGYTLPSGSADLSDMWRIRVTSPQAIELELQPDAGLTARIVVDWYFAGLPVARFAASGASPRLEIPAAAQGDWYVTVERQAGRGAYTLTTTVEPAV